MEMQDRQSNTEARSLNHCCHGKAVTINYYECVCVCVCVCVLALVVRHENRIFYACYCVVICDLSGFTIYSYIIS